MTAEAIARVDAWLILRSQVATTLGYRWVRLAAQLRSERASDAGEAAATEAAMTGVLLALVREAWGDPHASVLYRRGMPRRPWLFVHAAARITGPNCEPPPVVNGATEAEALVTALEAEPC